MDFPFAPQPKPMSLNLFTKKRHLNVHALLDFMS